MDTSRRGQVCVTLPHLPHGRTCLQKGYAVPCFLGSAACKMISKHSKWSKVVRGRDLSVAHGDMVTSRLSPSGLANRYGAILLPFPAAIELEGLSGSWPARPKRAPHDSLL